MPLYRTPDGAEFLAASPAELAEQLRESKFIPETTIASWMAASAERARVLDVVLRTDTVEHHIQDMLDGGLLNLMDD
ncbi:MAG: hypothetical protein PWQ57_925 [Desulfovibrionales bacterium]|nr:hypothetical protein [Desulfovibrionales bacterium]